MSQKKRFSVAISVREYEWLVWVGRQQNPPMSADRAAATMIRKWLNDRPEINLEMSPGSNEGGTYGEGRNS